MKSKLNLIILTISLGMFLWSFSAGIVNISLPTISQFMDIDTNLVSLIVIVHLLVLTSFLLIFGRIGDIYGYKKIYISGIALFTIGSYFCGISLDFTELIIFRIVQGIGSAMLLAMVPAIISSIFPNKSRGRIFGYISLTTTLGITIGYGVGGLLNEYIGWNWIFLVVVPFGILALILALKILPSSKKKVKDHQFDFIGAILIFLSVSTFIIPFNVERSFNFGMPLMFLTFIISFILGIIFFIWESKHPEPLFDIKLLKNFNITLSIIAGFMATLVLTGTIFLLPFFLQLIMGYSESFSGLIILIPSLIFIFTGPLSGYISDRIGSRLPLIIACIALITAVCLLYILNQTIGLIFIFIALGIRALSEGMFTPANNKLVMSHSPIEKIGNVSSLLNYARYLGLVMGVVVFNTIFDITVSNEATKILGVPSNGAFQFSAPVDILLEGFQKAFIVGIALSIIVLMFSILSKENEDYVNSKDEEILHVESN